MEIARIRKSRASTPEKAREIRQRGHDDAKRFALEIGLDEDYQNDLKAKKDVIDKNGDGHSVKSGEKKWQIFLYSKGRFAEDSGFQLMNGIGDILIRCIDSFPERYDDYVKNKVKYKECLRANMVELKEKLSTPRRLKGFIEKAMFNGGEVNYLTILHNGVYLVFWAKEVSELFSTELEVVNSVARQNGQINEQKVLLRYLGLNVGEIEMRNDSKIHYREIRFNMIKPKVMNLLLTKITEYESWSPSVAVYGQARNRFITKRNPKSI